MEQVERIVTRIYKYYFISQISLLKMCSSHICLLRIFYLYWVTKQS